MLKEFKQFALRGNMVDLAIGLMLGVAFGAVVGSLVKDVLTPPLGKLIGGGFQRTNFTTPEVTYGGNYITEQIQRKLGSQPWGLFLTVPANPESKLVNLQPGVNRFRVLAKTPTGKSWFTNEITITN